MPHQHNEFELAIVRMTAQEYAEATGLTMDSIRRDEHSVWIDWLHPDGAWAGTSSYDQPLHQVIEKLHRQIETEWQRIDPSTAQFSDAVLESFELELAV
jgi:hypothetical protein